MMKGKLWEEKRTRKLIEERAGNKEKLETIRQKGERNKKETKTAKVHREGTQKGPHKYG